MKRIIEKKKITRELAIEFISSQVNSENHPISWHKLVIRIDHEYKVRKNGWMLVRSALQELVNANLIERVDSIFKEEYKLK